MKPKLTGVGVRGDEGPTVHRSAVLHPSGLEVRRVSHVFGGWDAYVLQGTRVASVS